jgi:hypothetical protein
VTDGSINSRLLTCGLRHPIEGQEAQTWVPVDCGELEGYTLSVWVNVQNYDSINGSLCAAGVTTQTGSSLPVVGGLGIAAGVKTGRFYSQPGDGTNAARSPCCVMGQGPVHLAMRARRISSTQFMFTPYINGIPQYDLLGNYTNLSISGFYGGAFATDPTRLNIAGSRLKAPDQWDYVRFSPWCMSEDQLSAEYLSQRAKLGYAQPKRLLIFCADSLMAFQGAPSWVTAKSPVLRPGVFGALDAWGATYFHASGNNYAAEGRRGLRQRMIKYGSRHFEKVIVYWPYGTNDIGGASRPMSGTDWMNGANAIDAMIAEDRNTADNPANVENWAQTILPRADFLTTRPPQWELNRQAFNAWRRTNHQASGFAKVIDAATWTPPGHASFEDCVLHAAANDGNEHMFGDGLHWKDSQAYANEVLIPEFEQDLAA